ncbi:MAG: hypothetical protein KJO43_03090, partial [Phycisphaerae bacterium]|nr:hypothetical protein [Phycisphaerae bacterium]
MSKSKIKQVLGALLVIGVILAFRHFTGQTLEPAPAPTETETTPTARTERAPASPPPAAGTAPTTAGRVATP